uniref:U22-Saltitoxin-Pre1a_1 n=1 Tax=Phidippus regius TaxID=1905328 RepID=A0A482ZBE6_9ARAC
MLKTSIILTFVAISSVYCNVTSTCGQKEVCISYLDTAIDMISKAKENIPTCKNCHGNALSKAIDCADVLQMGHNTSGVYEIWPVNRLTEGKSLYVYCDMDTNGGGWTVIQRRGDFKREKDYFFRDWNSYKAGFGDIEKDFWLGNDNIFALTNQKLYSARFDLKDVEQNKRYALYDKFWIDDETHKYTLHISDYSGDAGNSMDTHKNQKFSTKDQDNDKHDTHCADRFKGGWWYNACHRVNLNGLYHKGKHESHADGVNWHAWKGHQESLEWTEIKIRPKNFRPPSPSSSDVTPV